jgi:predicted nucleotidyltransferase
MVAVRMNEQADLPLRHDVLTEHQAAVARAYLEKRAGERHHLVIYLSGAHAYGFPSPDSDLDLKSIHIARTSDLVGLVPRPGGAEVMVVQDGVEIDYGSNELGEVLRGVLKGNGNYLERILGDLVLDADVPRLLALRPLVKATLSRRVVRHYGGFATSQLRAAEVAPTAKKVLYVLRTARTGMHLLRTGELVTDLNVLAASYGPDIADLKVRKLTGERAALSTDELGHWRGILDRAMADLNGAVVTSVLPDEPTAASIAALEDWLKQTRHDLW